MGPSVNPENTVKGGQPQSGGKWSQNKSCNVGVHNIEGGLGPRFFKRLESWGSRRENRRPACGSNKKKHG